MNLTADYLIIGSGAMGMAFADILVEESEATLIIVDKNEAPGGHWNFAYPFVTLHQPALFYGVSSRELSNGKIDNDGVNEVFLVFRRFQKYNIILRPSWRSSFCRVDVCNIFPNVNTWAIIALNH